jgi:DNA polymerase
MSNQYLQYSALVEKRRTCNACKGLNVVHLSDCLIDEFGSKDIGPWTEWQGNLDAELMIVGQEWGGTDNYIDQEGRDEDRDAANANLVDLLDSIGRRIEFPSEYQKKVKKPEQPHFFTNAVLCLRRGKATTSENGNIDKSGKEPVKQCFRNCAFKFLKPQIDLVNPKVIVTLGYQAYRSVIISCGNPGMKPEKSMKAALGQGMVNLGSVQLFPRYHCGAKSTNPNMKYSRTMELQKKDWQSVSEALGPSPSKP